jgi:hypothetical protein
MKYDTRKVYPGIEAKQGTKPMGVILSQWAKPESYFTVGA